MNGDYRYFCRKERSILMIDGHKNNLKTIIIALPMSAFLGSSFEFEPGVIMVLSGLSKVEMNGTLVDLQCKNISDVDGSIRWKCIPLKGDDEADPISIKPDNLLPPPVPSAQILKRCDDICTEAQLLFRKARNSQNMKFIEKAKKLLNEALVLVPQFGMAYNSLGDIAHFTNQPQSVILKYMRRAVANGLKTPEDNQRIFQARFGYAGTLGNMNDFAGEQRQLHLCLTSPELAQYPNGVAACHTLLGDSYRLEGEFEKALDILAPLREGSNAGKRYGEFIGQSIDKNLDHLLIKVSYHFYTIAERIERNADPLPASNPEKLNQFAVAKESYDKAYRAAPNDSATRHAWTRINAKLNPDLVVTELPSGQCQIANMNNRMASLNSALSDKELVRGEFPPSN